MALNAEEILRLVQAECAQARYIPLEPALRPYRVQLFVRTLTWEYGEGCPAYPAWVVAELGPERPDLQLAFSEHGHGRRGDTWGILFAASGWFGMDSSWFKRLEDAFIDTGCWPGPLPSGYAVE